MKTITELVQSLAGAFFKKKYAAPIEEGSTPSKAYSVGDFLIHDGQFCRVTRSLSTSTTMVIGTNLEATTIGNKISTTQLATSFMKTNGSNASDEVSFPTMLRSARTLLVGSRKVITGLVSSTQKPYIGGLAFGVTDDYTKADSIEVQNYGSMAGGYIDVANNYDLNAAHIRSLGYGSQAVGYIDDASGSGQILATGAGSHIEGGIGEASGQFSHCEGGGNILEFSVLSGETLNLTLAEPVTRNDTEIALKTSEGWSLSPIYLKSPIRIWISSINYNGFAVNGYIIAAEEQSGITTYTMKLSSPYAGSSYSRGTNIVKLQTAGCGAYGADSHSEGGYTVSVGNAAHSEGCLTRSVGDYSHAEGYDTTAQGNHSHAGGSNATALLQDQFVQGGSGLKFVDTALTKQDCSSVFGFQPGTTMYSETTTITDGYNGCSGCIMVPGAVAANIPTITIQLATQGIYQLYTAAYNTAANAMGNILGGTDRTIIAHGLDTGTPSQSNTTYAAVGASGVIPVVTPVAGNKITIKPSTATQVCQFHLIRIM